MLSCSFCTLIIIKFHARRAYIQHYQTLLQELQGDSEDTAQSQTVDHSDSLESADIYQQECTLLRDGNFNVACKTGLVLTRYPAYNVMCHRQEQFVRV